ncbi:flagellar biosynthetic protein FliO [Curvibacter sp. RS43]|uniref:Flagellar biosynthetic protein FliO n=1 Tax=Curvibacter microcysteis TaxID=3026419 RepID=A0ABT5ML51_9BURK|nr:MULTISPECIES: flagellar biosynthetic protein FliO [unclassified Curvibacter]MDD0811837.1 flagellar biosynthetic protein FliO [Curvibacter sp. RS43]MDD0816602.1 flagellar biosynthetic protein FliO [Curvibacter sp. HBC28]
MWQSLGPLALLVALLAMLPMGLRWLQRRQGGKGASGAWFSSDLISSVAVGPQQRVVTVEVGPAHARTWLVLGVTAQQVTCLHTIPLVPGAEPDSPVLSAPAAPEASNGV